MRQSGPLRGLSGGADRGGYSCSPGHQPLGLRERPHSGEDARGAGEGLAPEVLAGDQSSARALWAEYLYGHSSSLLYLSGAGDVSAGWGGEKPLTESESESEAESVWFTVADSERCQ